MTNANENELDFEVSFAWNGEYGRVVAAYGMSTIELGSEGNRAAAKRFVRCRVNDLERVHDIEQLSERVREEVLRVIGRTFMIPRGVRLGAVMYIERP